MTSKFTWLPVAGLVLSGCANPFSVACTDLGRFAVHVQVWDAATGQPAAEGATLIIREGDYQDSMRGHPNAPPPPVLFAGPERAGTYQVLVRKDGYQDWARDGIQVTRAGRCDELQSAKLKAELERVPSA